MEPIPRQPTCQNQLKHAAEADTEPDIPEFDASHELEHPAIRNQITSIQANSNPGQGGPAGSFEESPILV